MKVAVAVTAVPTVAAAARARAADCAWVVTVRERVVTAGLAVPPTFAAGARTRYFVVAGRAVETSVNFPFFVDAPTITFTQSVPCLRCSTTLRAPETPRAPVKVTFSPAIAVDGDAVNDPAAACCAEAGTDTVTRPVTSAAPESSATIREPQPRCVPIDVPPSVTSA